MVKRLGLAMLFLLAGCKRDALTFACGNDGQCGAGGYCVNRACAFSDSSCTSGLRYDKSGALVGGRCVAAAVDMAVAGDVDSSSPATPDDMATAPGSDLTPPPFQWTPATGISGQLWAVWSSTSGDAYAVGDNGLILHTSGNGSWSAEMTGGVTDSLTGIWGSSNTDIYAVGGKTILHRDLNGKWSSNIVNTANYLFNAVWGSGSTNIYVGGALAAGGPVIIRSDGTGWSVPQTIQPSTLPDGVFALTGSGSGDIYAGSLGGVLLHSSGDGKWSTVNTGASNFMEFRGLWESTSGEIYAAGGMGLFHSLNGSNWSQVPNNVSASYVWASSSTDIYILNGDVLHSTDGANFTRQTMTNVFLYGIWGTGPRDIYAVGKDTILHGH